ncbi:hypothetical protein LPH37_06660, partial [Bifidobacterium longum subsp. longum]|uniref:hypothetical protein n=1 Tax=Bifidobacterium longum TaxID=216816 RepID=UPI001E469189
TPYRQRTDHRAMDGHDPKCATFRALPFFEQHDHKALPVFKVRMRATNMLKRFVLMGGFDIDDTDNTDGQSETKNEH